MTNGTNIFFKTKIQTNPNRISEELLNKTCYELADFLLGKLLVRRVDNAILKGRIVETECYLGNDDKASHSYAGRKTPRNEPMYMRAGTAYVYFTYGMYYCFNISSAEPGGAVLIRALEPIEGIQCMRNLRQAKCGKTSKELKVTELCNGPAKLCISMNITKDNSNKLDLCESESLWLEFDSEFNDSVQVVRTSRIGIKSAGLEWASKPLRFYIYQNLYVSKRDKKAENSCEDSILKC